MTGRHHAQFEPDTLIARALPHTLIAGTVTPLIGYASLVASGDHGAQALGIALYMALGLVLATWMGCIVAGIACLSWRIVRGPERHADAYRLPDSPRPKVIS